MLTSDNKPAAETGESRLDIAPRERGLVVASNRGPLAFSLGESGRLEARRSSGGLVTTLSAVARHVKVTWVASAVGEADRVLAQRSPRGKVRAPGLGPDTRLRLVAPPVEQYDLHYNVFANSLLWFVQHNLPDLLSQSDLAELAITAWRDGYQPVNRAFAEAILAEVGRGDTAPAVLLHDYHLYLVAGFIRERAPAVLLRQFVHIPWPAPDSWRVLPDSIVHDICRGLLANDLVGFQTERDVAAFLATCAAVLPETRLDHGAGVVRLGSRRTVVRAYPCSVDGAALRELSDSPVVLQHERRLRLFCVEKTIVRVDRLDPSKNVLSGFRAYASLLERRPDLRGRVKFLAFLAPARAGFAYQRYARRVVDLVASINATHGYDGWRPIELFLEDDYPRAIAALRLYDVLLVNPSLSGMSLVAKEGPIVNQRDGVLVLSDGAGSFDELSHAAVGVAPHDAEAVSRALEEALAMPEFEREVLALALRRAIERNDALDWLRAQLRDLAVVARATPVGRLPRLTLTRSA
ncbi:MAG: trehalose-6-phosphate synthase [Chloroflexi bacterium]|nr:trehalose-6-phosphate synthase [Chloroflexota bacterium]